LKQYDAAIDNFEKALSINPRLMDVFTNLVILQAANGEIDQAMARCNRILEEFSDDTKITSIVYNLKGGLYLAEQNTSAAEAAFKKAVEKNSNYLRPYFSLARIYMSENRQDEAIEQYNAVLEKDPKQAGSHMMLGTIYEMQKRYDLAEKHYRKTLEINSEFAPAANNLAYILAEKNRDLDEALVFARKAKEFLPDDPNVMDTLGWIYYKKGLYGNAVAELSDALEKLSDNPIVNYHLGMALYKKGETGQARAKLERALSISADFEGAAEARETLANL
jgi:tetratricopeptide (TPR) repeat protein